ncbi:MAG: cytidylate kinase family protein [Eubacteriales bacterium]|jgi:cytidylate kinase
MHITITGKTGSGKTTISHLIANELGYERYSTGEYQREIANKLGVNMVEMNAIMKDNITYDHLIDKTVERISRERAGDNLIFDSRMAWHFVHDSFKIFVTIDPAVAGQRVFANPRNEEPYKSPEDAATQLTLRSDAENIRFRTIYGVDNFDYANFDLIIDTTYADIGDYVPIVKESLEIYTKDREHYRRRIYLSPQSLLPLDYCCNRGCDEIIIVPYKGRHYVIKGHAKVLEALRTGQKYIVADIPREAY